MYIHPINIWEDEPQIIAFIRQNAFGTLVAQVNQRPHGTHLPFVLDKNSDGKAILTGHIARANPQWKSIPDQSEVLVMFQGPHAYISSSWYNHENVPTWNYLAVHVYGKIRIIEGEELLDHLKTLVNIYEEGRPNRVTVEGMSDNYLQSQIRALVGFEIVITEVQASAKLSQNRDETNYDNIVAQLSKSELDLDKKIASEMKEFKNRKKKS
ncbi:MAG: FMN-binding negative transcriptional regulator [Algoriphagus sp.]|uniref:FMN-binding negative transcriptional regulator n=1 Tax=Algoriphagus sp. TaxID=1872435 RepID=UPI002633EED5|nr:FMN-binding negative transcriptional regulator [Algoriphagus sp.]MDG1277647.1 FMN-binding negative transcriptional regulator [Algoriphagus sp.]